MLNSQPCLGGWGPVLVTKGNNPACFASPPFEVAVECFQNAKAMSGFH